MNPYVNHLIVDAVAFLKNEPLHEIGHKIYSVKEVVDEIKDKQTKERLQVLPYELVLKVPNAESIKAVTDFSKKTGDFPTLSATDLKVMALTYQIHKETVGVDCIRTEPQKQVQINPKQEGKIEHLPGFYIPSSNWETTEIEECNELNNLDDNSINIEDYAEEDEDESSWVTPDNLNDVIKDLGLVTVTDKTIEVGCITADFAMQNVLLQMGLNVLAVDGKLIKTAKTFILRCYGCLKTTSNMVLKFCPHCGNATLKRVQVKVNEDGEVSLNINFRRGINIRGKKFSLPTPKGGKHSTDPILCADQPVPQNRLPYKATAKTDALNPDYAADVSPFALNDVHSRSAQLRVNKCGRVIKGNPNKVRGPGKRK